MKKRSIVLAVALTVASIPATAADLTFCPVYWNKVNITGNSVLEVWGVSGWNEPLIANPDYGWPTEASVYTWYTMIVDARTNGSCVSIYYNPNLNGGNPNGHDIWAVGSEGQQP